MRYATDSSFQVEAALAGHLREILRWLTAPSSFSHGIPLQDADNVTDCGYTNAGAILSLYIACTVADIIGVPPAQTQAYRDAYPRIVIPFNASSDGISGMGTGGWHPEYQGYGGGLIKQADIVLLGFPMGITGYGFGNMSAASRANDLIYYGSRTDPGGPAMTWAMHAVGFAELKRWPDAAAYFNRSFATIQQPFGVWWECTSGCTSGFITGAGGFLQAAYHGYTGLRINDTTLSLDPTLPEGSSYVKLRRVAYLGVRLSISYNATTLKLERHPAADSVASVEDNDVMHRYEAVAGAETILDAQLSLWPRSRAEERDQSGKVAMGIYPTTEKAGVTVVKAAACLRVITASGSIFSLKDGSPPLSITPLQPIYVTEALSGC